MTEDVGKQRAVKSAERVLQLLEILGENGGELGAVVLAERTGIPRSSLHGLLQTLLGRGWIQESSSGGYALAPTALTVGVSYLDHDTAVTHATVALERARERLGYTINLARLINGEVVYLATREDGARRNVPSRLGRRVPAFATALGRALLAELSTEEARAMVESAPRTALTAKTVTDVDTIVREIGLARDRGYSTERSQMLDDVACVAVAVPYRMPATDAISCSMPVADASDEAMAAAADVLMEEAHAVARTLRQLGVR